MSSNRISTFDGVFFITISTLLFGCFGVVIKYCLKSRCDTINLCYGMINIHRDVKIEEELEMRKIELGIKDDESKE
jgi:hypothetical protein